jgi:hypothetical protein
VRASLARPSLAPAGVVLAAALLLASCPGTETPSVVPSPSGGSSATSTPTLEPTPTPSATPSPTPNQADVPIFVAGALVTTRTTVRLRDLPGTQWGIATQLGPRAVVQVVLGPVRTSGYGWYLVRDADPGKPSFVEGWVAAGFAPAAFLASAPSATPPPNSPTFIAGFADVTDGNFGPFRDEGSTAMRWALALPPDYPGGTTCRFTGTLAPDGGKPVTFLTTSVAQAPATGTVQASFFANHPTLKGDLFLNIESDCSWAVTVVRLPI